MLLFLHRSGINHITESALELAFAGSIQLHDSIRKILIKVQNSSLKTSIVVGPWRLMKLCCVAEDLGH